ncbi:MAG: DUF309 domain-containing protein [Sulfuricurvum sp.]|uniref:DUF309 domain-containing protein n=1 Tax=Sulfuricurvum sp. TaxID=2025608 RepID=UPI0025E2F765|nr:DUF309 domain-containing protein [Sulfuricurvum sp.]MCK9371939.1 DUF309 domain-containing protein [Sulfuricurvum sp.]
MAQEFDPLVDGCEAFLLSIREGRYYDAHEDFEVLWYPRRFEDNDEVRLWKGFINAAVSFELIKRERPGPSRTAWNTYRKYCRLLGSFETPYYPLYVTIIRLIETQYRVLTAENQ